MRNPCQLTWPPSTWSYFFKTSTVSTCEFGIITTPHTHTRARARGSVFRATRLHRTVLGRDLQHGASRTAFSTVPADSLAPAHSQLIHTLSHTSALLTYHRGSSYQVVHSACAGRGARPRVLRP
eukprot:6189351-Pleurochrysis_carterae.AAC.4